MAYVITGACEDCKDTACVTACPVDAIAPLPEHPGFAHARQLFIDPQECIHCHLCQPECPVDAIFPEEDLPEELLHFAEVNRAYFEEAGPAGLEPADS